MRVFTVFDYNKMGKMLCSDCADSQYQRLTRYELNFFEKSTIILINYLRGIS